MERPELYRTHPRLYRFFLQSMAKQQVVNHTLPTDKLEQELSFAEHHELLACKDEEWAIILSTNSRGGDFVNVVHPQTLELNTVELRS